MHNAPLPSIFSIAIIFEGNVLACQILERWLLQFGTQTRITTCYASLQYLISFRRTTTVQEKKLNSLCRFYTKSRDAGFPGNNMGQFCYGDNDPGSYRRYIFTVHELSGTMFS